MADGCCIREQTAQVLGVKNYFDQTVPLPVVEGSECCHRVFFLSAIRTFTNAIQLSAYMATNRLVLFHVFISAAVASPATAEIAAFHRRLFAAPRAVAVVQFITAPAAR